MARDKRMARRPQETLGGIDLAELDLSAIELEEDVDDPGPNPWTPVGVGLAAAALLGVTQTETYQRWAHSDVAFFVLTGLAVILGFVGGRWFMRWAERSAAQVAETPEEVAPRRPPPAWLGTALLGILAAGTGLVLAGVSPGQALAPGRGGTLSPLWFGVFVVATVMGAVLARWLFLQAENPFPETTETTRFRWPPWAQWVILGVLVLLGLGALVVEFWVDRGNPRFRFGIGALGLIAGVVAAVWLVRRFDQIEKKIKSSRARNQRF